jgi:hypothetical protein
MVDFGFLHPILPQTNALGTATVASLNDSFLSHKALII